MTRRLRSQSPRRIPPPPDAPAANRPARIDIQTPPAFNRADSMTGQAGSLTTLKNYALTSKTERAIKQVEKKSGNTNHVRINHEQETDDRQYHIFRIQSGNLTVGGLLLQRGQEFCPEDIQNALIQSLE